jgi:hypothetical protein
MVHILPLARDGTVVMSDVEWRAMKAHHASMGPNWRLAHWPDLPVEERTRIVTELAEWDDIARRMVA